jgi:iron complex outermembrane receptor protein
MKKIEKKTIFNLVFPIFAFLLSYFLPTPVFSQEDLPSPPGTEDELDKELQYLKAETYVVTASRIPENIKKTASSVTVITDKEIRQMGARNLADVLQTVPGMNCYYHYTGTHEVNTRGLPDTGSARLLIMINGHSLNENYAGGATWTHDTLMLDNVKRIEVIRGPGSALYGSNAFAGVINLITKEGDDVDGWELTTRGGSFDTQQYNLLYGKTFNELDVLFNYNYFDTHGFNGHVNEDLQTSIDSLFLTNASLAPERMKGDDEKYDASLNVKYKGFKLDGKYVDRKRDLPVGIYPVLNNKSISSLVDYYLNLSYERTLFEGLDLLAKVYRNHNAYQPEFQFFPPGSVFLTPWLIPVSMPKGTNGDATLKNNRTGFEIQPTYKISESNIMVAGITYEEMKQYDVRASGNFLFTSSPFIIIPLPRVMNLPSSQVGKSVKRNFKAFFIEDIWDITGALRLTAGIRYDDYSDFGDSFNPRVGLTWEFIKGHDLKLLYGSAFRAPNFNELYDVLHGDPDLDPEEVDTYQVSLGAEITPSFSGRVTWYQNEIKDAIDPKMGSGFDFLQSTNYSTMRSQGLEMEMRYDLGRGSYLALNYTNQLSIKRMFEWFVPRHVGNIMANFRLSRYLNLYTSCHFEDGFRRQRGDNRDNMSGYAIFNTTLIAQKFLKGYEGLELRASVYNLFDKDYTSPAGRLELPQDIPRPGRSFLVEAKYKF